MFRVKKRERIGLRKNTVKKFLFFDSTDTDGLSSMTVKNLTKRNRKGGSSDCSSDSRIRSSTKVKTCEILLNDSEDRNFQVSDGTSRLFLSLDLYKTRTLI